MVGVRFWVLIQSWPGRWVDWGLGRVLWAWATPQAPTPLQNSPESRQPPSHPSHSRISSKSARWATPPGGGTLPRRRPNAAAAAPSSEPRRHASSTSTSAPTPPGPAAAAAATQAPTAAVAAARAGKDARTVRVDSAGSTALRTAAQWASEGEVKMVPRCGLGLSWNHGVREWGVGSGERAWGCWQAARFDGSPSPAPCPTLPIRPPVSSTCLVEYGVNRAFVDHILLGVQHFSGQCRISHDDGLVRGRGGGGVGQAVPTPPAAPHTPVAHPHPSLGPLQPKIPPQTPPLPQHVGGLHASRRCA